MRWISKFSVILLLLIFSSDALAAPKKSDDQKRAAEIAMRAVKVYREGKYKDAALLFLQAYEISKRPAQVRNAAKAYEEGGMLDESFELWTRYRDHEGVNNDEKAEAVAHLKLIEEKKRNQEIVEAAEKARVAAEAARADAQKAREAAQASEARSATRVETNVEEETPVASFVLMGTGGASLIAGGVLWLVASNRLSKLDQKIDTKNDEGLIIGTTPAEVDSEVSGINTTRVISGVLMTAGVVALGTGVVWLLVDSGPPPARERSLMSKPFVSVGPEGALVGFSGSF